MDTFLENDIDANALGLVKYFDLKEEKDVPMKSFEIEINGSSTGLVLVCKGKYKSALFLLYLAKLKYGKLPEHGARFQMDLKFKKLTLRYFGRPLCDDALNNSQTKHTTIRNLLSDGNVVVLINCKRGEK